jgi:hypothetical protein
MITINDVEFDGALLQQVRDSEEKYEQFFRRIVFGLYGRITDGNPVDSGRSRANWFVTRGTPSSEVDGFEGTPKAKGGDPDSNAAAAAARAESRPAAVSYRQPYEMFWITNNLPYIEALELGTSGQAPSGFVRIAIAATEAEVESLVL